MNGRHGTSTRDTSLTDDWNDPHSFGV